ncbi:MAG TPA: Bax inhibitor-1/YccA family protein [Xanthobacteraceae bacterium]|jgi:FtsH-binding integral membrane protein|nr:Bax inhibitor-1/YccA family protein [Xanthobacteraceae bacterium]
MSDFDRNYATFRGVATDRAVAYDMGLRAHMIRVYNYMAGGVALTGVVAWLTYQMAVVTNASGAIVGLTPFGHTLFGTPLMWLVILAPLGLVFFMSFRIGHIQASTARLLFFIYAASIGLSLATIFMVYTATSITRVFFISAASFGALSLYGYTTTRSLNAMGSFLIMGVIGLLIAMVVNMFLGSSMLQWMISILGVGIFAGLTAWDTQKIKEFYDPMDDGTVAGRKAVMGALSLYLDFLNMFQFLLQLMGDRR